MQTVFLSDVPTNPFAVSVCILGEMQARYVRCVTRMVYALIKFKPLQLILNKWPIDFKARRDVSMAFNRALPHN